MNHILISDFDETITLRDTIAIFASLPYLKNAKLKPTWSFFVDNYMKGWNIYHKQSPPRGLPIINQIRKPLSMQNFKSLLQHEFEYQEFCRKIELHSTCKVLDYGIFSNLSTKDVQLFAKCQLENKEIILQDGFKELLASQFVKAENFYIISINWSKTFIYNVINEASINIENIFCNDLLVQNKKSLGMFPNTLLTGSDKIATLEDIMLNKINSSGSNNIVWYIGDSETDILPILHPRVNGILLLDPSAHKEKFDKLTKVILGIDEIILDNFKNSFVSVAEIPRLKEGKYKTYLAKSWGDIHQLVTNYQ